MFDVSKLAMSDKHVTDRMFSKACGNAELATSGDTAVRLRKLEVQDWLPAAASVYNISSNIRDYVVVPVIIVPSDIPNRNSVAFPYEDLLAFNPQEGRPSYATWIGKPTFLEHVNQDYSKAKGIVFDSYMVPMKGTKVPLAKVICLCGFDRRADPHLASQISNRAMVNYSMGAMVGQYECSICGTKTPINSRKKDTECGHVVRGRLPMYQTRYGQKPAYYLARGISGFEVSAVKIPAWPSANEDRDIFSMI